jgi:hypothetical protein
MLRYSVRNWTTVIFGNYDLTDKVQVAAALDKATKHAFDGEPMIFPIPAEAPDDIPRIALSSKSQKYRCSMASSRLQFTYDDSSQPGKELRDLTEPYLFIVRSLAECIRGELKFSVSRLGVVVTSVAFPDEEPVRLIHKTFIRDDALSIPHRLEIHTMNKSTMNTIELNKWCRISSMEVPYQDGPRKALSVIFDLNTLPAKQHDFGPQMIVEFCSHAVSQVTGGLGALFPEQS